MGVIDTKLTISTSHPIYVTNTVVYYGQHGNVQTDQIQDHSLAVWLSQRLLTFKLY